MLQEYELHTKLMGSGFQFIVTALTDAEGRRLLDLCVQETRRIEALLTEFTETSDTAGINRLAGIKPAAVSSETYTLIERCIHLSRLTHGCFDITVGPLKKLYHFKRAATSLPSPSIIQQALRLTGYRQIELKPPNQVYLRREGMRIGFAAIGKGYAADRLKKLLQQNGVESAVVNASGDLTAWGKRPNGQSWKTGITDPEDASKMLLWLPVDGFSVATSGNYIQYFDVKGKRYSHNINPLTGYPVTAVKSVSVISPSAELSDALATAVTVMGVQEGIGFVNQLPQTHCLLVDENNRVYHSRDLNIKTHAAA